MFRERLDRIRFVVLVLYHVLVTLLITAGRWLVSQGTAVFRFVRYQISPSSSSPRSV